MTMTTAERQTRYLKNKRAKRDPKFFLLEANDLFDRIRRTLPSASAQEILHLISREAAKRQRHLARLDRLAKLTVVR